MTSPKYPWLLPSDHPLYHPFYGFARPMTPAAYRRALAAFSRRFQRELREFEQSPCDCGKGAYCPQYGSLFRRA